MLVRARIASLVFDPKSGLPVVVLMETSGERALPIVIGAVEAEAIALALRNVKIPRPRTHDLLHNVLTGLGVSVDKVVVSDLKESTFYAVLHLRQGPNRWTIDSRPSDALALAVRTKSPIFVHESVLERAHVKAGADTGAESEEGPRQPRPVLVDETPDPEKLADLLANLDPEDFGDYKM